MSEFLTDLLPLDKQAKRALRILLDRDAIEDVSHPLDVLTRLERRGLVRRVPHLEWDRRGTWECYKTTITERGRDIAAAVQP